MQDAAPTSWDLLDTLPGYGLDLDGPVLEADLAGRVLAHLKAGKVLTIAAGKTDDEISGEHFTVPIGVATDGEVTWDIATEYYLEHHGRGVSQVLVDHILSRLAPVEE